MTARVTSASIPGLALAPHDRLHIKQNRMRRRGRWGWPAPGGVAGLRKVDGRYLRGSAQVDRGHEACWQIAAWMARHVGGAHKLPAVSLRFPLRVSRVCQRTVARPRGPDLPRRSRDRRGIFVGV
jgi:hypothetical protein